MHYALAEISVGGMDEKCVYVVHSVCTYVGVGR